MTSLSRNSLVPDMDGGYSDATLIAEVINEAKDKPEPERVAAMLAVSRYRAMGFDDLPEKDTDDANEESVKVPDFARPDNLKSLAERLSQDMPPIDWLVRGVVVALEPLIIGGPQKVLKTSIALAMAIALATATPFLGVFPVPKRRKVLFLCGESGERTTISNAGRMLDTASLSPEELEHLILGFELPALGNEKHRLEMRKLLKERQIEVVIIDPAYLCLLAGAERDINTASVFDMGDLLRRLNAVCKTAGATLVLLHHTKKAAKHDRCLPTELDDLSQAGFREFARQWVLLSRRNTYDFEGHHELRMDVGGSAGHSGCYAVEIETGRLPDPLGGFDCFDDDPEIEGEKKNDRKRVTRTLTLTS